jgi:hypothetical protein
VISRAARIGAAKLSGSVVVVPLSCVAGARCAGTVRVRTAAPLRIGRTRKLVTLTRRVRFDLSGKQTRNVRLTLTKAGRTVLKRARRMSVKVVVEPQSGTLVIKRATLRR